MHYQYIYKNYISLIKKLLLECVGNITYLPSVSNVFRGALGGGCALNTAKAHKTLGS